MNKRGLSHALDHYAVGELGEAAHFADKRGKRLNAFLTIHPGCLAERPADVGHWLSRLLNKIRIWCRRAGLGYFCVWVRENYEGDRRENVHLLLCVPAKHRDELEAALRSWLPGAESVVHLGEAEYKRDRFGREVNKALTYMMKQMTPQAWFKLHKQVRREKQCRVTHAPVAPVLGKRWGVSRTLNKSAREAFWTAPSRSRIAAQHPVSSGDDKAAGEQAAA